MSRKFVHSRLTVAQSKALEFYGRGHWTLSFLVVNTRHLIIANVETLSHDDSCNFQIFSSDGHVFGEPWPMAPSGSATGHCLCLYTGMRYRNNSLLYGIERNIPELRSEATSCAVCWSAVRTDSATSWVENRPHHPHNLPTPSSPSAWAIAAVTASHCISGLFAGRH